MPTLLAALACLSAASFLFYGYETLMAATPRSEFDRYGLPGVRGFVGSMQLAGAVGVLCGLFYRPIGVAAAAGLSAMMVLGLIVRFRIHDHPQLMIPAASLGLLNATLVVLFLVL